VNYISLRCSKEVGCTVDQESPEGLAPFASYVLAGNFTMASKLKARGADINYRNKKENKTVLVMAV